MRLSYPRTELRRKLVDAVLRGDKTATAGLRVDFEPHTADRAFALDEGEGFEAVADWRRAHERFWADQEIGDDTLIVAERFRVLEPCSSLRTLAAIRATWMLRDDSGGRDAERDDDIDPRELPGRHLMLSVEPQRSR